MPSSPEARSLAVFCDFENVALGVREAKYAQFDMEKVLERLLLKGSIVVKKAYCDWDRYKEFKATMHAASFELIEIPHLRQSGKNSADIRMVVDALSLLHQVARRHLRHRERRLRLLAAGLEAAREREDRDRRRRQELELRPADRQLRRVHLLRRPGARGRAQAPRRQEAQGIAPRRRGSAAGGLRPGAGDPQRADRRARRGREDLGLDDQAGAQAAQARLQRVLLRLPRLLGPARGGREEGP